MSWKISLSQSVGSVLIWLVELVRAKQCSSESGNVYVM